MRAGTCLLLRSSDEHVRMFPYPLGNNAMSCREGCEVMAVAQAGTFLADRAEGCVQAALGPGSTLLIPASWPHAVVTQEDAVVVGGNFLHALDLRYASAHEVETGAYGEVSCKGCEQHWGHCPVLVNCCSG